MAPALDEDPYRVRVGRASPMGNRLSNKRRPSVPLMVLTGLASATTGLTIAALTRPFGYTVLPAVFERPLLGASITTAIAVAAAAMTGETRSRKVLYVSLILLAAPITYLLIAIMFVAMAITVGVSDTTVASIPSPVGHSLQIVVREGEKHGDELSFVSIRRPGLIARDWSVACFNYHSFGNHLSHVSWIDTDAISLVTGREAVEVDVQLPSGRPSRTFRFGR